MINLFQEALLYARTLFLQGVVKLIKNGKKYVKMLVLETLYSRILPVFCRNWYYRSHLDCLISMRSNVVL